MLQHFVENTRQQDLQRVLEQLLDPDHLIVISVGPENADLLTDNDIRDFYDIVQILDFYIRLVMIAIKFVIVLLPFD